MTSNYEARKIVEKLIVNKRETKGTRFLARISQIVDYIFFAIYGILSIRLLLALFETTSNGVFVQIFKNVTDPFYSPFMGIFPNLTAELGLTLVLPIIVALFVYMFLYLAINGLLRIFVNRETIV